MPVEADAGTALKHLSERCAPHLVILRRSAMFALSRGAKELFHTNFLAFVLELDEDAVDSTDRHILREVRQALLTRIFGTEAPTRVVAWREAQGLDLVLAASPGVGEDGHPMLGPLTVLDGPRRGPFRQPVVGPRSNCIAIIEAKLKALPDVRQLRRYDELLHNGLTLTLDPEVVLGTGAESGAWGRLDVETFALSGVTALLKAYPPLASNGDGSGNGQANQRGCRATGYGNIRRLLLAPVDPSGAAVAAGWEHLPWSAVLDDFGVSAVEGGGGLSAMLRDYATSTRALLALLNEVNDFVCRSYVAADGTLTLSDVLTTSYRFKPLRIHDVVGKRAYSALQGALEQALQRQSVSASVGEWQLEAEVFMTRGEPGICIEYKLSDGDKRARRHVSLGVQIQGTAFRRYLSASHAVEAKSEHSLQRLTELVGEKSGTNGRWWALKSDADMPLRKFGAEAFLYVGIDATTWSFEELETEVTRSVRLAAVLIQDSDFREGAYKLMRSRRPA